MSGNSSNYLQIRSTDGSVLLSALLASLTNPNQRIPDLPAEWRPVQQEGRMERNNVELNDVPAEEIAQQDEQIQEEALDFNLDELDIGTDQVGTDQVGTDEVGKDEVGTDEDRLDEVGTDEVGTDEVGTDEVRIADVGMDEVGMEEFGTDVVGMDEVGMDEVETDGDRLDEVGTDEVGMDMVGTDEADVPAQEASSQVKKGQQNITRQLRKNMKQDPSLHAVLENHREMNSSERGQANKVPGQQQNAVAQNPSPQVLVPRLGTLDSVRPVEEEEMQEEDPLPAAEVRERIPGIDTYLTGSGPLGTISVAPTVRLDRRGYSNKRPHRSASGKMGQPDAKRGKVLETRHALLWYHAKCLKDAVERQERVTAEQQAIIADLYEKYEESGCSSLVGRADQDYQEMKTVLMRWTQASTERSQDDVEMAEPNEEGNMDHKEQPEEGVQPGEESLHELDDDRDKKESGGEEDTEELPSRKPSQKKRNKRRGNYYARFAPMTLFTTPLVDQDLVNASGEQVAKLASEWRETRKNHVYKTDVKIVQDIYKEFNTRFAKSKGFDEKYGEKKGYATDMTFFEVKTEQELLALKNEILKSTSCLIRGIPEALNMNLEKFSSEALEKIAGDQEVEVLLQHPQSSTENVDMKNGKSMGWKTSSLQIDPKITYSEFLTSYKRQKEIDDKAVDAIINDPENKEQLIHDYIGMKLDTQYEYDGKAVSFPVAPFATNIDLDDNDRCAEQIAEINKLVEFLRPKEGMMKLVKDNILGVNTVQCYVKSPGSRTPAHQENQLVASVNLNMGPGECVWINVSMVYAAKMEELMNKKRISPYHSKYWPTEQDLIDAGIPYQKLVQKAGDLIYVGVGTYHWVQANGYCVNAAWNVAEMCPVQLAAAVYSHDNNVELKYGTLLPIYDVLLEIAQQDGHLELKKLAKQLLIRPLARAIWEWDYCEEGFKISPSPISESKYEVKEVYRCWGDRCRRNQIQNIFCVQEEKEKCLECVNPKRDFEVYYRKTREDLVKICDNCK